MLNSSYHQASAKQNPYLVQKVMTASPEQLIAYMYDAGVAACGREDKIKAIQVVQELINALKFDNKEVAVTFFSIYRYIQVLIREKNFKEARDALIELKLTWAKAHQL